MSVENTDDFEYPKDPQELLRVIEEQEGPPEKCPYTLAALLTLSDPNVGPQTISNVIKGARDLRILNLRVYGVPYSAHSVKFKRSD